MLEDKVIKKRRKRFISLLLVVIMAFASPLTASAEAEQAGTTGKNEATNLASSLTWLILADEYGGGGGGSYYTPDYYTIEYKNCEGASNPNTTSQVVGNSYTLQPATKSGYKFEGWYYDEEFKNAVENNIVTASSVTTITVYAKWTADITSTDDSASSAVVVTLNEKSFTFSGEQIKPEVKSVVWNGETIPEDQYTVSYGENLNVGKGTVTITPNEDSKFIGKAERTFNITKARKFKVLYQSKRYFLITPEMFNVSTYKKQLSIVRPSSRIEATSDTDKISVSETGELSIKNTLGVGTYTVKLKAVDATNYEDPETTFDVIVPTNSYEKVETRSIDENIANEGLDKDERTLIYDLMGGKAYIKDLTRYSFNMQADKIEDYYDIESKEAYKIPVAGTWGLYTPISAQKANYTFGGWYTDKEYKSEFDPNSLFSGEENVPQVVYAKWLKNVTITTDASVYNLCLKKSKELNAKDPAKRTLTYKSSNPSVVTVSSKGIITAKNVGKAIITISAPKTDKYAASTKKVTVKANLNKVKEFKVTEKDNDTSAYARWKRSTDIISCYEFSWDTKSTRHNNIKTLSKKETSIKLNNKTLLPGKTYYLSIRTVKIVKKNGKKTKYYSDWCTAKKVELSES